MRCQLRSLPSSLSQHKIHWSSHCQGGGQYQTGEENSFVKHLTSFIQINDGMTYHCVGHSLGSHTCGFAGKNFAKLGLTMSRISALDPAGPLFLKRFFDGTIGQDAAATRLTARNEMHLKTLALTS